MTQSSYDAINNSVIIITYQINNQFVNDCFPGTCQSIGNTVDGMHPHDVIEKINNDEYDIPEE